MKKELVDKNFEGNEAVVVFEENGRERTLKVYIEKVTPTYVLCRTDSNKLMIPLARISKIKQPLHQVKEVRV